VNLDHGQQGIGSQSCGPGPLPQYFLNAQPTEFSFVFSETVYSETPETS
jgi:beta-galactosidase